MKNSYLAIVDIHGLRTLCLEQDDTQLRLAQQLDRADQPPAFLVWAVLKPESLRMLYSLITSDRRIEAWQMLQHVATCLGRVSIDSAPDHAELLQYE